MDERFVSMERGPDLPALKERSFCVRLKVDDDTDIAALFAKARRMQPGRLVVGEVHREEMRHLFALLVEVPTIGGLATLRAETVHKAVAVIAKSVGDGDPAAGRAVLAAVRPVFVHMHSDEKGRPRLAALWSVGRVSPAKSSSSKRCAPRHRPPLSSWPRPEAPVRARSPTRRRQRHRRPSRTVTRESSPSPCPSATRATMVVRVAWGWYHAGSRRLLVTTDTPAPAHRLGPLRP